MESEGGGWELRGVVKLHGAGKGDGVPSLYGHWESLEEVLCGPELPGGLEDSMTQIFDTFESLWSHGSCSLHRYWLE